MTPCEEYPGCRTKDGYGKRFWRGKTWLAHRAAWTEAHGDIPEGMKILHSCDNPPCVKLEHLRLGTQGENIRECVAKGRHSSYNRRKKA